METDFSHLYAQLGLEPGCSLDALRHAYRRRISELHPDRHAGQEIDPESQRQLSALIQAYKDALRFHAAHGRLPGGSRDEESPPPATGPNPEPASIQMLATPAPPSPAPHPQSRLWLLSVLVLMVLYLLVSRPTDAPQAINIEAVTEAGSSQTMPVLHQALSLGMSREEVLALQGEPTVRRGEDLWEYGPSWVRFDNGRLAAWYSSPLHRLKTRQQRVGAD